jgi:hypothetical protein
MVNIEAGRQHAPLHLLWRVAEAIGTELASLIPTQEEFRKHTDEGILDTPVAAFIEVYADGNPTTRRLLTAFVKEARAQADVSITP